MPKYLLYIKHNFLVTLMQEALGKLLLLLSLLFKMSNYFKIYNASSEKKDLEDPSPHVLAFWGFLKD